MAKRTYFQIFVDSVNGSDIVEVDTFEEAKKEAIEWATKTTLQSHEKVVVLKVDEEIAFEINKVVKKSDLHFIGCLKGISQYEVKGDTTALVLELSDRYYLSHSKDMYDYQDNLVKRVCGCYSGGYDRSLLGDEVVVIKDED